VRSSRPEPAGAQGNVVTPLAAADQPGDITLGGTVAFVAFAGAASGLLAAVIDRYDAAWTPLPTRPAR
jgi:hypothetical protein